MTAVSSGLTLKYQKRHFYKSLCEELKHGTKKEHEKISLDHVKTILILLLAGLAVSTAVFCMERVSFGKLPHVGELELELSLEISESHVKTPQASYYRALG